MKLSDITFTTNSVLLTGLILIIILLVLTVITPTEYRERRKKKKKKVQAPVDTKDYKQASVRLEKHILKLNNQIASFEKEKKSLQKDLLVEKVKAKKMQEKITQERGWHEKEKLEQEKNAKDLIRLQEALKKSEDQYGEDHAQHLRLQREFKELKNQVSGINEQRRVSEANVIKLETQVKRYLEEIVELKRSNAELKKKSQDVTWIAKSEYDKLTKELKEKDKALDRLKREKS